MTVTDIASTDFTHIWVQELPAVAYCQVRLARITHVAVDTAHSRLTEVDVLTPEDFYFCVALPVSGRMMAQLAFGENDESLSLRCC